MKSSAIKNQSIVFFFIVTFILLPFSCKKELKSLHIDPAFSGYVISFTSGVVSNASKVQVRLVQEVTDAKPGKVLEKNPFDFSPGVKGRAYWVDKQTIEFAPDEKFSSGDIYTVSFDLSQFVQVPSNLKTLKFRFQVMKQNVRYEFNGISPYSESNMKWQKVNGIFYTADVVENSIFENIIEINGADTKKVSWNHSKDGRTHNFSIDSVERKSSPFKIEIEWKGKKIGAKNGSETFEMPGLDQFKVLHVKTSTSPNTQIEVFFSDPLSRMQDLDGLFSLSPNAGLKVMVAGTSAKIIPTQTVTGEVYLTVYGGIRNVFEKPLGNNSIHKLKFVSLKPQVELIGEGVIIPNTGGILFPFRAVSLSAVDVKVIKIFENNIVQFLQVNQLNENQEIKRVGRVIYNQTIQLTSEESIDYSEWNNFSLDLSKLIDPEPGAIYRVEIGFSKKYSLFPCSEKDSGKNSEEYEEPHDPNESYNEPSGSYWDYYESDSDYDYENFNWQERDDPCKPSYYMDSRRRVSRNVLASDLGIIAKAGTNNEYFIAVTDLRDTKALSDVDLEFRNYQNQIIKSGKTNSEGFCNITLNDKPFVLVAKKGKQRGYLRLDDASSLSLSMFDVSGEELKKGIKGFIYGERGVWRPGDLVYLNFILEDKNQSLPANYPVVLELFNPSGQIAQHLVRTKNTNGFYSFILKTPANAPTGNWTVKMHVGGSVFARNIRIETVKPNRLKINLNFASSILHKGVTENGNLQVNWLHGAPASNAKVKIEATMAAKKTEFAGFKDYNFDDPSKKVTSQDITIFNGNLNAEGKANVTSKLDFNIDAPGMIAVQMKTTAFEAGGDFSIDRSILTYSPYTSYVGVKIPQGKGWNGALNSDEKNLFPVVVVNENGKPVNASLKIEVYNVYWRWWWEQTEEENLASYISNQHTNLLKTDYLQVVNGRAFYEMNLGGDYYGRKLIKITDTNSGHSTGGIFYTTYRGWWSNAGSENPGGAEMLMFQANKKEYKVGETVSVELPVTHSGKALISIETGSRVLKNFWFEPKEGKSKFTFEATPEMAPNIYIHVSFIQPHNHGKNDFPIRMYGVQAVKVEDPDTHISPIINMPDELKPQQKFNVKIQEKNGKPMTYTIAIVDEGLLDITRFKTPNPWETFYAHEALGVRTWDLYKYVAGAFTGKMAGLFAIGGDQYFDRKGKENNNRFKPVVLFQGPFSIDARASKTHTFTMPNYIGSVRVMVVAGNKSAYGSAEKAVPVRQSLMVLPTLPRVISPTEIIKVPVSVFAMDKKVKNVTVKISADANFELLDGTNKQLVFEKTGEKMVEFTIRAKNKLAEGKIIVTATSGAENTSSETNLKIRMPNPPATTVTMASIEPGKSWSQTVSAFGIQGTNSGSVEISRIYPINLEKRLQYLIQYPHGCIEQIVSAAFPQLYLKNMMDLTEPRKAEIELNVKSCLDKLKSYQITNGGFGYWPGESYGASEWGTNYAGHFMLEAQALGYQLPVGILTSWIGYQTKEANDWKPTRKNYGTDLIQAYRLYTLALAKKPALSAMNLMRETAEIDEDARWRLAAAYCVAGKSDIGAQIINGMKTKPAKRENYFGTYGSADRDEAMILETLVLLKRTAQAKPIVQDLANILASNEWLSTQSTAYMLLAISKFTGDGAKGENLQSDLTIDGTKTSINTPKAMFMTDLNFKSRNINRVSVVNNSKQTQYVRVTLQGIPLMNEKEGESQNLELSVRYFDMKGAVLNPSSIKQGTQFYANIVVQHPGVRLDYNDMALSQLFPSGWEILNTRMDEIVSAKLNTDQPDYQDIRDDRVYMYFDIAKGKTKTFRVLLQAAYLGKFYLPSVQCEAMYDNTIRAYTKGQWVEVVR
ncbi:MAG TPA: MG2 domain-containing protein [Paludibacter sp.]|nr:MG2 domain-containing protein [Paludibacter sp.]